MDLHARFSGTVHACVKRGLMVEVQGVKGQLSLHMLSHSDVCVCVDQTMSKVGSRLYHSGSEDCLSDPLRCD